MLIDQHSMKPLKKTSDEAVLVVGGVKISQGTEDDMKILFDQEIAHSKASVELRIKQKNGSYITKRKYMRR